MVTWLYRLDHCGLSSFIGSYRHPWNPKDVTIFTLSYSSGVWICYGGDASSINGEVERPYFVRIAGAGRGIVSCLTMKDCLPG